MVIALINDNMKLYEFSYQSFQLCFFVEFDIIHSL